MTNWNRVATAPLDEESFFQLIIAPPGPTHHLESTLQSS